jgi:hypothetical protein
MQRKMPHPASKIGKFLFSKTKYSKKQLTDLLILANETNTLVQLDNFEIIEVTDLYDRLKDWDTYKSQLNKDVFDIAMNVMRASPNGSQENIHY